MSLAIPLKDLILSQQQTNDVKVLPVELEHVLALQSLPSHHSDPFDRLLIAQSKVENAVLVTKDKVFKKYKIKTVW